MCYAIAEYAYTLKVEEKSDVYSFGVNLLELVTGRKPVGEFGNGVDIVQWVRKMTDGNMEGVVQILDPRLLTVPIHEVMHLFYVGMLCVEEQAVERPTMREVQMLTELPKPPNSKSGDGDSTATVAATTVDMPPSPVVESPTRGGKDDQEQKQTHDLLSI
ncbi:putative protein kinase RLK-Pelle-LRR-XI-1 family [Helianthus annuus]|nr:putative protein kinase RLK-Pelle-LRR-XI-1 family [Helianthus annuus]KAJ0902053.1 putative protein kinase RLK-Pelle-LRR-XI-1 family [Helianthus annuus]